MQNRLSDVLRVAKMGTKYYKDLIGDEKDFKKDFSPKLTKSDVQNQQNDLLVDEYRGELINYLEVARTSGSTGVFVEVLWHPQELLQSNLCLWRRRNIYYNVKPNAKYLTFHSNIYEGNRVLEIEKVMMKNGGKILSLSKFHLNDDNFVEYLRIIKKFQPQWIFTQPSTLLLFLEYLDKFHITCEEIFTNLQYIELTGEICLSSVKKLIKNKFQVPVANMYGCNETNSIAYECPNGHMHVMDDNVYIKIVSESELTRRGKILVTSLFNKVMPIIDYELNDIVEIEEGVLCPYSNSNILNVLVGRTYDAVRLPSGQHISSLDLLYCLEKINENMGNIIKQFQFRVNAHGNKLVLHIDKGNSEWENSIKKEFELYYCKLHEYHNDDFELQFVYKYLASNSELKSKIFVFES